jgi:hypothetical protein
MTELALCPLESQEQATLFGWARLMENRIPELRMLYHVPNGGHRNKIVAAKLKAEGVRGGVPDICLPVARNGYHGLYVELKRRKGGKATPEQMEWIAALGEQGYFAAVCYGFDEAREAIENYLTGAIKPQEGLSCRPRNHQGRPLTK